MQHGYFAGRMLSMHVGSRARPRLAMISGSSNWILKPNVCENSTESPLNTVQNRELARPVFEGKGEAFVRGEGPFSVGPPP